MSVRVGEDVLLGVEMIDVADKGLAFTGGLHAVVGVPELPVVAAADFAVTESGPQSGRDLEVGAHLQNAVGWRAGRDHLERLRQARLVCVQVPKGFFVGGPGSEVGDGIGIRGRGPGTGGRAGLTDESVCPTLLPKDVQTRGAGAFACQPHYAVQELHIAAGYGGPVGLAWHVIPSSRATSGRDASRFRHSKTVSSSPGPTGTFRHTSSGNSRNEPTSETSVALPNPSARSSVPELSPTVGYRRLSTMSQAAR